MIGRLPEMSAREYKSLRAWIVDNSGIDIPPAKRLLLIARLAPRMREIGMETFGQYFEHARMNPVEGQHLIDRITTNETRFFRDPQQFAFLENQVFPVWRARASTGRRSRTIRVWSAGCSTGQEAYSLAMLLLRTLPEHEGWRYEIWATDISNRALAVAREATWPAETASQIPTEYVKSFMFRGVYPQEGAVRASPKLRRLVRVERVNLIDAEWPQRDDFDLIFCRNVLIYFPEATAVRLFDRLLRRLRTDGLLFVGHSEALHEPGERALPVRAHVYRNRDRMSGQEVFDEGSR
jgi:chemotaxis protein methyltransferase CheR